MWTPAEDDEICNGDEFPDEWLDSWYPENSHESRNLVIEAKRKEMERFKKMKVYRVCYTRIDEK